MFFHSLNRPGTKIFSLALVLLLIVSLPKFSYSGTNGNHTISEVDVLPTDTWEYQAGFRWESSRELIGNTSSEYDNMRLEPVGLYYGYMDWVQLGTQLTYSSNSENDGNGIDEGGIEQININSRFRWDRNFATEIYLGYGLSDDVFPYGGDGIQLGINLPGKISMGPGAVIGDLGFTINSGEVDGSQTDWDGYFNYGLGYDYELTRTWSLTTEIVGNGATIDPSGSSAEAGMELIVTPSMEYSPTSSFDPSISVGLDNGSPDFSIGLDYSVQFGSGQNRRVPLSGQGIPKRPGDDDSRSSDSDNQQGARQDQAQEREQDQPLVLPGDLSDQSQSSDTQRDKERAQELADQGRNAFQQGNLDQAIEHYKNAVDHDPENVEILSNLGSLYYRKKNYEQAQKYYDRAVESDPNDQFTRFFLGVTHYKLGNQTQARNHLTKARDLDPNSETGKKAKNWLDRIG